jgi:putative flippase GtrA
LALRYAAFAIMATICNLVVQRQVMAFAGSASAYYPALLTGTFAGLMTKYELDRRWIFPMTAQGVLYHGRKFSLYTLMGIVTTAIFWSSETLFWHVWETQGAREIGACLGLSVGYLVKYHLDRRYVFISSAAGAGASQ